MRETWQPIASAPKDKSVFLAFGRGHGVGRFSYDTNEESRPMCAICHWDWIDYEQDVPVGDGLFRKEPIRGCEGWRTEFGFTPTHWMPLPDPPAALTGDGGRG